MIQIIQFIIQICLNYFPIKVNCEIPLITNYNKEYYDVQWYNICEELGWLSKQLE